MLRITIFTTLIALSVAQYRANGDPRTAAIIMEQRYLSGDGKFGSSYQQEDGINFKEETDSDGTRHGSYSYIDPNGQKRTISYTAGKNGFQATGDDIPQPPAGVPSQPAPHRPYNPGPQAYNPGPQAPAHQAIPYSGGNNYEEGQYDPRHNDPSFEGNKLSGQPQNNHYNPPPPPPQQQQQHHHHQAPVAPQQPASFNHNFQHHQPQQYQPQPQHHYPTTTPPPPHRFDVPGKLSLNRTPDGFSYSFNKV